MMFVENLLLAVVAAAAHITVTAAANEQYHFVIGSPIVGGTNGFAFDADNNMQITSVFSSSIVKVDPETGTILDAISGEEDGVIGPDDIVVADDGSLYWTDVVLGTLFVRPPNGTSTPLFPAGAYPSANPLILGEDGIHLYFGQCYNYESPNGVYRLNIETMNVTTLVDGIDLCASNSMSLIDGILYTPRPFEGAVYGIDLSSGPNYTVKEVTTGMVNPIASKMDSLGNLHVADGALGIIYRVTDLEAEDTISNREIVAELPYWSIDNLNFDKDDRLYSTSFATGSVVEVLDVDQVRYVHQGAIAAAVSFTLVDDVIYTTTGGVLIGFDKETVEEVYSVDTFFNLDIELPSGLAAITGTKTMAMTSFLIGALQIFNVTDSRVLYTLKNFTNPTDVVAFQDGVLVASLGSGLVEYISGEEYENRQIVASIQGATMVANGNDTNAYVSNFFSGQIFQIFSEGNPLEAPLPILSGLAGPEGMFVLDDNTILVLETDIGSITMHTLSTGESRVLLDGIGFLPPSSIFPFGYPNKFEVDDDGNLYFNADLENVIYKVPLQDLLVPPTMGPTTSGPVSAPTDAPVPQPTEAPVLPPTEAPVPEPTEAPSAGAELYCFVGIVMSFILTAKVMV